jgi:hypothetical protein
MASTFSFAYAEQESKDANNIEIILLLNVMMLFKMLACVKVLIWFFKIFYLAYIEGFSKRFKS